MGEEGMTGLQKYPWTFKIKNLTYWRIWSNSCHQTETEDDLLQKKVSLEFSSWHHWICQLRYTIIEAHVVVAKISKLSRNSQTSAQRLIHRNKYIYLHIYTWDKFAYLRRSERIEIDNAVERWVERKAEENWRKWTWLAEGINISSLIVCKAHDLNL